MIEKEYRKLLENNLKEYIEIRLEEVKDAIKGCENTIIISEQDITRATELICELNKKKGYYEGVLSVASKE